MIKLDFSIAVALYLIMPLGLIFCFWLFLRRKEFFLDSLSSGPRFIWCCSVCTYTYFTTQKRDISICPRCGSYNKMPEKTIAA